jgi:outer membrane biosynthesis protein TonB
MLHSLISPRPAATGRLRALPLSVAAHIIVILVIMSPRPRTSSSAGDVRREGGRERVQYIEMAPAPAAPARHASAPARAAPTHPKLVRAAATVLPTIAPLSINLASVADAAPPLPNVDLTMKVTDTLDFSAPPQKLAVGGAGLGKGTEGGDANTGVYTADLVEKTVMPFSNNPKPVYPPSMLSAGIETAFIVRFVVDTTGRVDDHSLNFPSSAGRLFVDAVQRVLLRSRYRPAELGGRRVAQLVEQQFTFRIAR